MGRAAARRGLVFLPPQEKSAFASSGYPFLPEGSEDHARVSEVQTELIEALEVEHAESVHSPTAEREPQHG